MELREGLQVEILEHGEWVGPFTVTNEKGRTPEHVVLIGRSGRFEHCADDFNIRPRRLPTTEELLALLVPDPWEQAQAHDIVGQEAPPVPQPRTIKAKDLTVGTAVKFYDGQWHRAAVITKLKKKEAKVNILTGKAQTLHVADSRGWGNYFSPDQDIEIDPSL